MIVTVAELARRWDMSPRHVFSNSSPGAYGSPTVWNARRAGNPGAGIEWGDEFSLAGDDQTELF